MKTTTPYVIDLLSENRDHKDFGDLLFQKELERIRNSEFRLKKNYLSIDFRNYYCFNLLVQNDQLIAFSGMQKPGPWNPQVARIAARLYIAPEFRPPAKGLRPYKLGETLDATYHPNSAHLAPYQVQVAKRLGLTGVFFTRENPRQRRNLPLMIRHFTDLDPTHPEYEVYDQIVNVCPRLTAAGKSLRLNNEPGCWQNAVILRLKPEFELGLPTRSVNSL